MHPHRLLAALAGPALLLASSCAEPGAAEPDALRAAEEPAGASRLESPADLAASGRFRSISPGTGEGIVPQAPPGTGRVSRMPLGTLFHLQQSSEVLIYDVRPAFIHRMGHIPGSASWPVSAYDRQLAQREIEIRAALEAGKPVVFYCTDLACPDARNVASALALRGHSVYVLEGGWDAWTTGQLPTA